MKSAYFMVVVKEDGSKEFCLSLDGSAIHEFYGRAQRSNDNACIHLVTGCILDDSFLVFNPSAIKEETYHNSVFQVTVHPYYGGQRMEVKRIERPNMCEIIAGFVHLYSVEPPDGEIAENNLSVFVTGESYDAAINVAVALKETLISRNAFIPTKIHNIME